MTTDEMLATLTPLYCKALGQKLKAVPQGITPMEWALMWQATAELADPTDFAALHAKPAADALAMEGRAHGCDAFGPLRIVDRSKATLNVSSLITRRRPREFVVYAVGWKEN